MEYLRTFYKHDRYGLAERKKPVYMAVDDAPDPDTDLRRSHLRIHVTHEPTWGSDVINYNTDKYAKDEQLPLFERNQRPGRHEVTEVTGTERGRSSFPLLLAIANRESLQRYGKPLTPSADLSPHSLKIVNNLKERGLVSRGHKTPEAPTNDRTFDVVPTTIMDWNSETISEEEIAGGRAHLKSLLSRRRNLSPQFDSTTEQLRLEGL